MLVRKELAEDELLKLDEKWGKKYPIVLQSWQNKWENKLFYHVSTDEVYGTLGDDG